VVVSLGIAAADPDAIDDATEQLTLQQAGRAEE
jgi:hypothetical protein